MHRRHLPPRTGRRRRRRLLGLRRRRRRLLGLRRRRLLGLRRRRRLGLLGLRRRRLGLLGLLASISSSSSSSLSSRASEPFTGLWTTFPSVPSVFLASEIILRAPSAMATWRTPRVGSSDTAPFSALISTRAAEERICIFIVRDCKVPVEAN